MKIAEHGKDDEKGSMRVLVACEESQAVCKEFRRLGHEAYSCDVQPCSGGHPEWHIQADAVQLLKIEWDLIIAHPPCTYLTASSSVRLFDSNGKVKDQERERKEKGKGGKHENSSWNFT